MSKAPLLRCFDCSCVLQVATVFGRPKWDKIFTDIKKKHPGRRVGVFVCGPKVSFSHGALGRWCHGVARPCTAYFCLQCRNSLPTNRTRVTMLLPGRQRARDPHGRSCAWRAGIW